MSGTVSIVQRRIAVAALGCVLAYALIGVRLVDLTLLRSSTSGLATTAPHVMASRADIVDRNGELLARDLVVQDVSIQPYLLADRKQASEGIAAATGLDAAPPRERVCQTRQAQSIPMIARQVTPEVEDRLSALGLGEASNSIRR